MTCRTLRPAALVLATAGVIACGACGSQSPNSDQRVAELESKLADVQKQLDETAQQAKPADQSPPSGAKPAPAQQPATPRAASSQDPKTTPEAQRLVEQQKAVDERQAAADVRLQQQVDRLLPQEITLPAGTIVPVRTTSELSTAKLSNGSTFDALLERDIRAGDTVVAKARTRVTGVVVSSDPGGRVKGTASLTIGARSIVGVKGNVIAITTDSYSTDAESTQKKDAVRTGVATGVGAIIGGIAGGGSGAAKGAGAGAAVGVGATLATRGAAAVIPAEALIELRLTAPVTIVMQR